jgi:hypothetical protein
VRLASGEAWCPSEELSEPIPMAREGTSARRTASAVATLTKSQTIQAVVHGLQARRVGACVDWCVDGGRACVGSCVDWCVDGGRACVGSCVDLRPLPSDTTLGQALPACGEASIGIGAWVGEAPTHRGVARCQARHPILGSNLANPGMGGFVPNPSQRSRVAIYPS